MNNVHTVVGPNHCFLVLTKTDGERIAIDASYISSIELRGPRTVVFWLEGQATRTAMVDLPVDTLVQMLCSDGIDLVAAHAQGQ